MITAYRQGIAATAGLGSLSLQPAVFNEAGADEPFLGAGLILRQLIEPSETGRFLPGEARCTAGPHVVLWFMNTAGIDALLFALERTRQSLRTMTCNDCGDPLPAAAARCHRCACLTSVRMGAPEPEHGA